MSGAPAIDMAAIGAAIDERIRAASRAERAELALEQAELDQFFADVAAHLAQVGQLPSLHDYDVVLINSSAGKDSQLMLSFLVWLADRQRYPREKLLVVHANLGRMEWPGTRELAEAQAAAYGLRFEVVARDEDLLDQVVTRNATLRAKGDTTTPPWMSSAARYCTSDQKTAQVVKLQTRLAAEHRAGGRTGPIRILNCLGIRAGESTARAAKAPLGWDPANWTTPPRAARKATAKRPAVEARDGVPNGRRRVTRWLPIFHVPNEQVWPAIRLTGMPWHPAYDLGMPRLSCVFCILAPRRALVLAARANPDLADQYLTVERETGFTFKADLSMAAITEEAAAAGPLELPALAL